MYRDLMIIIIVLLLAVIFFKKFSAFVYVIVIVDVFLRMVHFLANELRVGKDHLLRQFPYSFTSVFTEFMKPPLSTIFTWLIFICYGFFIYYAFVYLLGLRRR